MTKMINLNALSRLKMSRTNQILVAVLVIQLVLGGFIVLGNALTVPKPGGATAQLLTLAPDSVIQITIHDGNKNEIVLARKDANNWVLPNAGDFPIDSSKITILLNSVKTLQANRLIAQNVSSQTRLKVSTDSYERLIEFGQNGGKVDRVYLGTAVGGNATHVRVNDQVQIYLVNGLATSQVPATADGWINTTYFSVPQDQIVRLHIENAKGVFDFQKQNGVWTFGGLATGEIFNPDSITTLIGQTASISMNAPLGTKNEDRFGMAKPLAKIEITIRREVQPTLTPTPIGVLNQFPPASATIVSPIGQLPLASATPTPVKLEDLTYQLQIGAKLDNGNYVIKSSESSYYVQVQAPTAEGYLNLVRDSLLAKPTPTPFPTATTAATAAPTNAATAASTTAATTVPTIEATAATTVAAVTPAATTSETAAPPTIAPAATP